MGRSPAGDDFDDELVHTVAALERTALGWERTAIGLAAVGALLLKLNTSGLLARATGLLLVAAALTIAGVAVPLGYRRAAARVDRTDPAQPFVTADPLRPVALMLTAGLVSLTAAVVGIEMVAQGWVG